MCLCHLKIDGMESSKKALLSYETLEFPLHRDLSVPFYCCLPSASNDSFIWHTNQVLTHSPGFCCMHSYVLIELFYVFKNLF